MNFTRLTSNVDELLSFSLRAAAISWSELGLPSLSTVVLVKGWSHGEILEKTTSPFPGQLGRKGVLLGISAVVWIMWFSQLHESTKTFCKHFSRPCQQFNRKQLIPVLVIHIKLCEQGLE